MSSWTIYSRQGTAKYKVDNLEFHDTWMGEEYVMVNITSPTPLDIEIGDYLIYRGLTYSVYSVPSALKQARRGSYGEAFKYDNIKLSSRGVELTDLRFLDYVLEDNNIHYTSLPTFSFHCMTVDDLLDRLQANTDRDGGSQWYFISPSYSRTMQRYQPGTAAYTEAARLWDEHFGGDHDVEPSYERTDVNISVDKQSVWDGLIHIKNDFNLNFIMRERAVIVGGEGLSVGHMFRYGKGNGLYQIERVADQDQKVTTKLFAYGSDKNLPIRYYANITRICFAKMYARPSADSKTLYLNLVWSRSYVTGTADSNGKYPVVVSINGNTYNVKTYPYTVGARELFTIDASVSLSFVTSNTDIIFVSGIDKDKFPASNTRQMSGGMPNNMAVQVLMLPGFPQYALSELCRCTYDSVNDKTVYEIRKTPSSAYNEFMRVDGNHPVTFSNDALKPYILSGNADDLGIKEGDVHFTEGNDDNGLKEIYPSIEGMTRGDVEGTSSTERLDEIVSCDVIQDNGVFAEGVEIQNFNLVLKNIGFDLKEAFDNAGGNMTISMKDGYCGGRDFNVHSVKANANGTWTLNVERSHDESLDLWFPYSTNAAIGQTPVADEPYQIRTGDHFVLTEIEIGDTSYIWAAAMKMLRKSIIWLLDNDYTRFTYLPKVDEIYMARQHDLSDGTTEHSLHDTLKSGMVMLFEDEDLGVDGSVFIDSVTIKENGNNGIPTYDVVLRNDKQVGTMQRIQNQIQSLTSYVNGGGGLTPSQIRSLINTYGAERFLSKLNDDTAQGWITVLAGLRTLEDFVESSKGGALYTDEDTLAHLTTDVARIRERILGSLRIGDTAATETEPTLHVGGNTLVDNDLQVHEDLRVEHDAEIVGILKALNRIYTNLLTSDNYTDDSAFGTGFSLSKKKGNENRSYLVVDELFVRWKAIYNELEIREISHSGGNRVSSHAASKIIKVKDIVKKLSYSVADTVLTLAGQVNVIGSTLNIDGGVTVNGTTATLTTNSVTYAKRCYAMKDDGTTATMNWWKVNDQARCQTFNVVERGNYQSASNKSYWRRVLEVGYEKIEIDGTLSEEAYDYVDLSVADCMTGSDMPEAGDTIVQMGNRTDTSRQGFIISEVAGTSAPDIQIFRNVNSYTLEGKRKIILSPDETHLRVNSLVIETEYDARRVPMERGDWDAIPEHKCYYYDLVQYNGATWLCIYPESGIGGIKYTTEPPSETSIYWQIYAQKGADGKDGKDGKSFNILGSYDSEEELIAAHPTGQVGDAYIVAGDLYVWDDENSEWHNSGQIKGDTGRGISSVTISYGKSNTSTTIPSTWHGSVDAVGLQAGDYLFTRMVYNYTDGEPAQSEPVYSIGYIGRDGSSPIVGDIDNEVISVACDKDGKVLAEFNKTISVKMFNGSTPVTLKDISVSSASGITIDQISEANGTFRVHIAKGNTITQANNFTVTALATIDGTDVPRTMSFVVNGVRQGADGTPATIYDLIVSLSSIKKDKDGTPAVASITATRQKTVGSTISDTTDGTLTYKVDGGSEQTYTGAIQTSNVNTGVEFIFKVNGTVVDRETVPVIMDGQDGTSVYIDSQSVTYSKQSQGNLDPTTLTYGGYPSSLGKGDWLYTKTTVVYKNSDGSTAETTNSYSVSYIGTDGDNGVGISGLTEHYKASANPTGEALPSSGDWGTNPSPSDWDINKPYLWNYEKIAKVDKNGNTTYDRTTPSVVAIFTKGISSVINHYVATSKSSGVTKQNPSDGTWSTSVQNPTSTKRYLWNYETTEYSNGQSTETDPHIICVYGEKGEKGDKGDSVSVDEQNSKTEYVVSNQGTSAPTSGWSTTIPAVQQGQYLWTKVTTVFTDGKSTVSYGVSYRGTDGDNVQIDTSRTYVRYSTVKTASQPADSTFTLTTPPQLSEGDYLWSLSQTAYVGVSSVLKSYSVSRLGIDGDEGKKGADGYTTHFAYATSADGSQNFSTTNFSGATYIGTYKDQRAADSTNYRDYTWTEWKGEKGDKGDSITKASADTYRYAIGDSGITPPSSGWSSTKPSTFEQNKWLWTETTIHWSDNSTTVLYSAERNPNDGAAGQDIVVDGATVMKYAVSNNNTQRPTKWYDYAEIASQITAGTWLWSMATTYYRKSESSAGSHDAGSSVNYSVSYNGTDGADGRALKSMTEYYKATNSNSPMSKPSSASGWDDDPNLSDLTDKWDANHIYLWNMEKMVYTESDGTTTTDYTIPKILAIWTKDGDPGHGIDSIVNHYKISNSLTPPAKTDSGWSDTPVSPTASNPYLWSYETVAWVNPSSTTYTDVVMIGHFGKDGISVRAQYSANGTSWHDTFASTDKWMRTSTDNGTTWSTAMKIVGENGAETDFSFGISQYKTTDNAHTAPSDISTWSDTPVAVTEQKPYLWSKVVQKNGSGTVIDTSYIRMTGEDGTSVTIDTSNTFTKYQKGDSGTTIPTGTWQTTIPSVEQGKYLWTWVHTAYSDGSYTDVYTPTYQSNDGLPSAYINLSDSVVDIEVDENGKATKDIYEEITYTMGASGKTLYIKRVDVSTVSHVSIPAYILSPLADGLITVSGTTATLTKGGVTVSGTKATLPYGYTALPQIVVSAQDGETINEGVVEVSGVAIDKDGNEYMAKTVFSIARQYYAPALQIVLSQSTMILTQNELTKEIYLDDAYTDVSLRIGNTDITDGLTIKADVSTFYDETQERDVPSCNVRVDGNRVRITDIASYAYIPEGSTTETRVYCEKGWVDITVTYRGKPYVSRLGFYCNLLGSWKETIEGDVDRAIAESTTYEVDGQKFTVKDNLGEFVKSSTENTSKISQRVKSVEDGKNLIKQLTSGWVGADPSVDSITYLDRFGIEDDSNDMYSPVIRLKANTDYCFSAIFDYSPEGDSAYVIEPVSERTYNNGKELYDSSYGTTPQITWHAADGKYYFAFRTGASDTLFAFNYYPSGDCCLYRPQLEEGKTPTEFYASSYEQSSLVKQTADALTVQINGKATQSDINIAADQITATIKSKLGETGVNIDEKTITMKAEQTIFKDLSGREMISFEMVEYDGDNLPSLVFWDNKGKKGGNKSFILNWRGLLDMAQQSTPRLWGNEVMYGTLITDNSSFAEGRKVYAETLWFNIEPREGMHPLIIRVTKYMYNAGYTISEGRKIWNPANAGDYDGKTYDSNDEELYLPTGVIAVGWYISEITEYKTGTKAWRKTFSFKHYTGGMPDSSFVVCVDILSVYDIHGQIISTEYQINESLTDPSVTTGSDTAGEYIIIPTVNN